MKIHRWLTAYLNEGTRVELGITASASPRTELDLTGKQMLSQRRSTRPKRSSFASCFIPPCWGHLFLATWNLRKLPQILDRIFTVQAVFMSGGCITPDTPADCGGRPKILEALIPGQDDLQCYTFAPIANARPRQNDLTTSFRSGKRFSAELIQHQLQLEQLLPV